MPVPPYPVVPAPTTWANGPVKTSELRGDVTNGVNFLANRPEFSAVNTSTPAIPASAFTALTLDTVTFDPWAGQSPLGANPQNWYCQAPGFYLAEGYVPYVYTGGSAVTFAMAIGVNQSGVLTSYQGQQHTTSSGSSPGVFGAELFQMTKAGTVNSPSADYVQLQAWINKTGFTVAGATPNFPTLSLRWAGSGSASSLGVPANAAFPVPPANVGTAWLNANIRDALNFLANPPMFRYTAPGTQSIAPGSWPTATKVTLSSLTVDNYSGWSAANQNYVAPVAGDYYVYGQVDYTNATGSDFAAGLTVAGTTYWGQAIRNDPAATLQPCASMSARFRLNANDTIALAAFQDSIAFQTVRGANTKLIILWESA